MKKFGILLLLSVSFFGCAKKEKVEENATKVRFVYPKAKDRGHNLAPSSISSADAGVIIFGRNAGFKFSLKLDNENDSENNSIDLPPGTWTFGALAWDYFDGVITSIMQCAVTTATIGTDDITVSMSLSVANCQNTIFDEQGAWWYSGGNVASLSITNCSIAGYAAQNTAVGNSCISLDAGGAQSFRAFIPSFDLSLPGVIPAFDFGATARNMDTGCLTNASFLSGSTVATNITIPFFDKVPIVLEVSRDTECSVGTFRVSNNPVLETGHAEMAGSGTDSQYANLFIESGAWAADDKVHYVQNVAATSAMDHGDLDGDGDIDLVLVQNSNNIVEIYHNNGLGVMNFHVSYPVTSPLDLYIDDVNSDGVLDIIILNGSDNGLHIYNGDGIGGYTAGSIIYPSYAGGAAVALDSGDVDNDGDVDVVVSYASNIELFKRTGPATFSNELITTTCYGAKKPHLVNLDGSADGLLDLVAPCSDNTDYLTNLHVYERSAAGYGLAGSFQGCVLSGGKIYDVKTLKISGDSYLDSIRTCKNTDFTYSANYGVGANTGYPDSAVAPTTLSYTNGVSLLAGDINYNGLDDVFFAGLSAELGFIANASATPGSVSTSDYIPAGYATIAGGIADLNNDGINDIYMGVDDLTLGGLFIYNGKLH